MRVQGGGNGDDLLTRSFCGVLLEPKNNAISTPYTQSGIL
jgi:hypothetical protein